MQFTIGGLSRVADLVFTWVTLPEVPTVDESGLRGYEVAWFRGRVTAQPRDRATLL